MPAATKLAQIMAHSEGFGIPGAVPTLRNNPLDLRHGPHGGHKPGAPNDIAYYDTADLGWADGERQLRIFAAATVFQNPTTAEAIAAGILTGEPWEMVIEGLPTTIPERHLMNLRELAYLWAPVRDGNNSGAYLAVMVGGLGLPAETSVADALKTPAPVA